MKDDTPDQRIISELIRAQQEFNLATRAYKEAWHAARSAQELSDAANRSLGQAFKRLESVMLAAAGSGSSADLIEDKNLLRALRQGDERGRILAHIMPLPEHLPDPAVN